MKSFLRFAAIVSILGVSGYLINYFIISPVSELRNIASVTQVSNKSSQETIKKFSKYLEETNGKVINQVSPSESGPSKRATFAEEISNSLDRSDYRATLLDQEGFQFNQLVSDIEDQFKRYESDDFDEKKKLLIVTKRLGDLSPVDSVKQVLLNQAQSEDHTPVSEGINYSQLALQYFLDLEPDLIKRNELYQNFVKQNPSFASSNSTSNSTSSSTGDANANLPSKENNENSNNLMPNQDSPPDSQVPNAPENEQISNSP